MKIFNVNSLSVTELEELEKSLSIQLIKVQKGVIDDSLSGMNHKEAETFLSEKLLAVRNQITAKKIRG